MPEAADERSVDVILTRRAHRGDRAAFEQLARRWWPRLYRLAWNMSGSTSRAAEATERALSLALRFPGLAERDRSFSSSLYAALIDATLREHSAAGRSAVRSLDLFLSRFDGRGRLAPADADWSDLASDEIHRPGLAQAMRQMLQSLSGMDRAAFVLREIEQLTAADTAAILRISSNELTLRTHRATLLMRGLLERVLAPHRQSA
jgi:DNA-directed RNA polymerase specialized sigma24 family protein